MLQSLPLVIHGPMRVLMAGCLLSASEQGRRMPRLLTANKIADALEVPMEHLLEGLSNVAEAEKES